MFTNKSNRATMDQTNGKQPSKFCTDKSSFILSRKRIPSIECELGYWVWNK